MENKNKCRYEGCDKTVKAKGYCGTHHQRLRRWGTVEVLPHKNYEKYPSIRECLESGFKRGKLSDCWVWKKSIDSGGYGLLWWKGKHYKAHRVSYEVYKGSIPSGSLACHWCDNRKCVNPNHLFLGSQKDNVQDCISKDRFHRGIGERNNNAKITKTVAQKIKKMLECGCKVRIIAYECYTTESIINNIKYGKTWTNV
jgi:hypothetical protein